MSIEDSFVKKLIKEYQMTRNTQTLTKIKEHISHYIYNYPRKVFRTNHERTLDFYIYYLERIDKILLSYQITEVKFITWFTYTLRNSYLNFVYSVKRKERYKQKELSFDSYCFDGETMTLHDIIPCEDKKDDNAKNIAFVIFDFLNKEYEKRDTLIFLTHNLELFTSVIIEPIMKYFSFSYEEAYAFFDKARSTYIKKYKDIIKYQDIITNINIKILKHKEQGKPVNSFIKSKENNLKRLNSIRLVVPYQFIAMSFLLTVNAVGKIIQKIKLRVKESVKID